LRKFRKDGLIGFSRPLEYVEAMIGRFDDMESRERAEFLDDRAEQGEIRQRVACPLQEEHGHRNLGEVIRALRAWRFWRVERKAEEDESAYIREQALRGGLRRHASAHGFASGEDGKPGCGFKGGLKGCGYCCHEGRGRVGAPAALLHVRELVAQRCDVHRSQPGSQSLHERMPHSRTSAVRE